MLLGDRVALVTGASRGIGAATAKLLARHGAAVGVNYFTSEKAAQDVVEIITKAAFFRVGEEYRVGGKTPSGICLGSFSACLPYLTALQSSASFSWEEREGTATIGCPDPVNRVVWRLERR